jgi:probable HAF family extracellular repeat protein
VTGNSLDRFKRFPRPVVWARSGKPKYLGSLGGAYGEAFAINDSGQVVGWSGTAERQRRGFVWTKGVMERLDPLPGGAYCDAIDINSRGQVIGISGFSPDGGKTEVTRSVIWVNGVAVELGTLGGEDSWSTAINDAGDVVGNSPDGAAWRGFLWREGRMEPLPPLPGFTTSNATDIDAAGNVIGESSYRSATHGWVAVLTRWVDGVPEQLPLPYDGWSIQAVTNGAGVVVATIGGWEYATGPVYIFDSGSSRLLDKRLIGRPRYWPKYATGINGKGVIVGWGGSRNGIFGFKATPVSR